MQGRRVYTNSYGPGDYGKDANGVWRARPPDENVHLGSLENHTVTEHDDGTITVSPSILIEQGTGRPSWHGFLERGIWRKE